MTNGTGTGACTESKRKAQRHEAANLASKSSSQSSVTQDAKGAKPINIADVVKALEIATERLGDWRQSCETLRKWAREGRVTPAGQTLTVEAVQEGIAQWLQQRNFAANPEEDSRQPATPQGGGAKRRAQTSGPPTGSAASSAQISSSVSGDAEPKVANPKSSTRRKSIGASQNIVKNAAESQKLKSASATEKQTGIAVKPANTSVASAAPAPSRATLASEAGAADACGKMEPSTKRPRKTYAEIKQERLQADAQMKELTRQRLQEVLTEIDGHMETILRRTGPIALKGWKDQCNTVSDRRDLYTRLVHAVQDFEMEVPEELNAELLPHQAEGLDWLNSLYVNGLHGILADEMGLGKTIQTIALLVSIKERQGNSGPHLVVAPKSTLGNWETEFARFAPGYATHVLTGDLDGREVRLSALRNDIDNGRPVALITNYEQVHRNPSLHCMPWQIVVVDEGHRLKNPDTVLHKAMAQLNCRMRLLLTGTPLQNSVGELWALLHYLLPDLFTDMMDFKAWFAQPFKGAAGLSNEFEVATLSPEQEHEVISKMHTLLAPFLLQRLKSEALGDRLPPKVEATVRVPLSAWQRSAYEDLERRTVKLMMQSTSQDGSELTSEQVNNALMQLRKIALHPYLFQQTYNHDDRLFKASGKVEALDRILPKLLRFDHKVLIFSQFTSMLDILSEFLKWRRIRFVRLDGQVPHEQRKERIRQFSVDPAVSVFLLSSRAGGLGLNLQAADTVILFDLDWNPQNDKQAVARAHRVGQTREVRILRLVTDSAVEQHMEQRCKEKLDLESKIMGAGMFRRQATADQRRTALRAMLSLESATNGNANEISAKSSEEDATAKVACLTSTGELCKLLARSEKELAAFRQMDAALLKPRKGNSANTDAQDVAALLMRCGRLLEPKDVPLGFEA